MSIPPATLDEALRRLDETLTGFFARTADWDDSATAFRRVVRADEAVADAANRASSLNMGGPPNEATRPSRVALQLRRLHDSLMNDRRHRWDNSIRAHEDLWNVRIGKPFL